VDQESKPRTAAFRWNSRQELYSYFKDKFGLEKDEIDEEIDRVMAKFHPRKGESIKTQELWEKVGNDLEKSFEVILTQGGEHEEPVFEVKAPSEAMQINQIPNNTEETPSQIQNKPEKEDLPPQPVIEINDSNTSSASSNNSNDEEDVAYLDNVK
jgi:S-adenosylhomocysteine hydrolase